MGTAAQFSVNGPSGRPSIERPSGRLRQTVHGHPLSHRAQFASRSLSSGIRRSMYLGRAGPDLDRVCPQLQPRLAPSSERGQRQTRCPGFAISTSRLAQSTLTEQWCQAAGACPRQFRTRAERQHRSGLGPKPSAFQRGHIIHRQRFYFLFHAPSPR